MREAVFKNKKHKELANMIEDFVYSKYPAYKIWYSEPRKREIILHIEHKKDDALCLWVNLSSGDVFIECGFPITNETLTIKILQDMHTIKKWILSKIRG